MSMKNQSLSPQLSYRNKLLYSISKLPPINQNSFKEAITPHPQIGELFVPKNPVTAKFSVKKNENTFRKRIIDFNAKLSEEQALLNNLKFDSDKFSRQYTLVNSSSEDKQKFNNNSYLNVLQETYKKRGYDDKEIQIYENMFMPSLMNENFNHYEELLNLLDRKDINKEGIFMENLHDFLRNNKNAKITGKIKPFRRNINPNSPFISPGEELNHNKSVDEMTLREMKLESLKIKSDIRNTKRCNIYFNGKGKIDDTPHRSTSAKDDKFQQKNTIIKFKKVFPEKAKKIVVNDIFLSSKGMIRSAKRITKKNKIMKTHQKNKISFTEPIEDVKVRNAKRIEELNDIYSHSVNGNYLKEEKKMKNYYGKYGKIILEPIK